MTRQHALTRIRRRGYALPAVMLFLTIAFGAWAVVYSSSASTLRVEKARVHRETRAMWTAPALAMGLRVLQTGVPPVDLSTYKVTLTEGGATRYYRLTFERVTTTQWTVSCEPTDDEDLSPDLPASFI